MLYVSNKMLDKYNYDNTKSSDTRIIEKLRTEIVFITKCIH